MSALAGIGWDLASAAKGHIQQMDFHRWMGNEEGAEREFEAAWQLMCDARDAFLEEYKATQAPDAA